MHSPGSVFPRLKCRSVLRVVGSVREVIPFYTNTSLLTGDHVGDVGPGSPDQDDIRDARKVRGNHRDNVLFSSSVEVPGFNGPLQGPTVFSP